MENSKPFNANTLANAEGLAYTKFSSVCAEATKVETQNSYTNKETLISFLSLMAMEMRMRSQ
jgi:hypothetical protein